jgi:hypothetical protein
MSIATPRTFVQMHLVLQSSHIHGPGLSPVGAVACTRDGVYMVGRRKDLPSPSRQSVSTLAEVFEKASLDSRGALIGIGGVGYAGLV